MVNLRFQLLWKTKKLLMFGFQLLVYLFTKPDLRKKTVWRNKKLKGFFLSVLEKQNFPHFKFWNPAEYRRFYLQIFPI